MLIPLPLAIATEPTMTKKKRKTGGRRKGSWYGCVPCANLPVSSSESGENSEDEWASLAEYLSGVYWRNILGPDMMDLRFGLDTDGLGLGSGVMFAGDSDGA